MSYLPSEPIIDDIEAIDSVAITDAFSNQSYSLQILLEVAATMPRQFLRRGTQGRGAWADTHCK